MAQPEYFDKLQTPNTWQQYWTRYPQGYTILEALIHFVSQVNEMVENVNDWNAYLDDFVENFDKRLAPHVVDTLYQMANDGTLERIINEEIFDGLNTRIDNLENSVDERIDDLSQSVAQSIADMESDLNTRLKNMNMASRYETDGSGYEDDSLVIQQMLNDSIGKTLVLEHGKTYGLGQPIYVPNDVTIIANGAKFKRLSGGDDYIINITGNNVTIDDLILIPFGTNPECGVKISASHVDIKYFECVSTNVGTGGNIRNNNALWVYGEDSMIENIHLGHIKARHWERPFQFRNAQRVTVDYVDVEYYMLAVYLCDVQNIKIRGGEIRLTSPNALGTPGQNGILIESVEEHFSTNDVYINDVVVEDSAEHGFRVGGQRAVQGVYFENCTVRNPGTGRVGDGESEQGIGHGGCGFKVLGPTTNAYRHRNIHIINATCENGRNDVPETHLNFAGIYVGKAMHVTVDNPTVRTTGGATVRGFVNGMEIIGVEDMSVTNPNIANVNGYGIYIFDYDISVADYGHLISRISINGGQIVAPSRGGYAVRANFYTFRRLFINGTLFEVGNVPCVFAAKGAEAEFNSCTIDAIFSGPQSDVPTLQGTQDWLVTGRGILSDQDNPCRDGSVFADQIRGYLIRRDGAWTSL